MPVSNRGGREQRTERKEGRKVEKQNSFERKKTSDGVCVCVCVRERESVCPVCVCVCVDLRFTLK